MVMIYYVYRYVLICVNYFDLIAWPAHIQQLKDLERAVYHAVYNCVDYESAKTPTPMALCLVAKRQALSSPGLFFALVISGSRVKGSSLGRGR